MCQGETPIISIDMVINPLVGVYIPIIRIPVIKGGMSLSPIDIYIYIWSLDLGTYDLIQNMGFPRRFMSPLSGVTWESSDRMLKLGINAGAAKALKKKQKKTQRSKLGWHDILGGGFNIFIPIWEWFPIWLMFFKWVGSTTN